LLHGVHAHVDGADLAGQFPRDGRLPDSR
jgi:hypothetical protein